MHRRRRWGVSHCCVAALIAFLSTAPTTYALTDSDRSFLNSLESNINKVAINDELIERLVAIVNSNPRSAKALYLLGAVLQRQGYEQLAVEQYEQAIKMAPQFYACHFQLALLTMKLAERELAAKRLAECERVAGNDSERLFRLGRLAERFGYREISDRIYERAARAQHKSIGVGTTLAALRLNQGRIEDAIAAVDLDLAKQPDNATANAMKGKIYLTILEPGKAALFLEKAYRSAPCENDSASTLANWRYRWGQLETALEPALQSIICNTGKQEELHQTKRMVASIIKGTSRKMVDEKIEAVFQRIDQERYGRFYRFALGDVFDSLGRHDRAIAQYRQGVECKTAPPYASPIVLSRGLYRWALDEELWMRNYEQAESLYERASKLTPLDRNIIRDYNRLKRRLQVRDNDIAWAIKDAVWKAWLRITGRQPVDY